MTLRGIVDNLLKSLHHPVIPAALPTEALSGVLNDARSYRRVNRLLSVEHAARIELLSDGTAPLARRRRA
jgi:hypothetical protein